MTGKSAAQPQTICLDAGALVKRYLAERGSAWVESFCADEANSAIAIARFGLVETAAVFAAKRRAQFITDSEYESALGDLLQLPPTLDCEPTSSWYVARVRVLLDAFFDDRDFDSSRSNLHTVEYLTSVALTEGLDLETRRRNSTSQDIHHTRTPM